MPSALRKARSHLSHRLSRDGSVRIHHDHSNEPRKSSSDEPPNTTLAPASQGAMNKQPLGTPVDVKLDTTSSPNSVDGKATIRTVPSFETPSVSSSGSPPGRNSGFSSSVNSNTSVSTDDTQAQTENGSTARLKVPSATPETPNAKSQNMGTPHKSLSSNSLRSAASTGDIQLHVPESHPAVGASPTASPGWDGTVGKAALGKTGRVINKLVSDNEALKRDIKLEKMKAEEAKQAAKLMEDKMERMVAEYESKLLEANVTKTLLSRKERQVESLHSDIELQKKRATDAQERERKWKEEMEKSRRDANVQVKEAETKAALMEGRYHAIASHWKDQGDEVKRTAANLHKQISTLVLERKEDDDKINTLRELCDQQDGNIKNLKQQKDDIGRKFDDYKREQEALLHTIKTTAKEREEEQLHTIEETKRVLGELRWALNLKKNIPGYE